jgi:2-oxoglutarate ferredoxin oxidoreductase subunit alpha
VAGEAGQGVDTASELLARAMVKAGYHVFAYPDVMSRIRGGHNFTAVRVSDASVWCGTPRHNLLLALDEASAEVHRAEMVDGGVIVTEASVSDSTPELTHVPMTQLAAQRGARSTMANVVGLGALLALTGHPLDVMQALLRERFADKGGDVVRLNVDCLKAGADFVGRTGAGACPCALPRVLRKPAGVVVTGSQALALGALASDVRFYAGYPMSPATPVMEYLAGKQREFGLVVEQAEDEVGALNMVLGASYAGVRAMTATSGGGFSLMVEALGLAGMAELPCVVVIAQRAGPATGFPTRTEQGELLFAVSASQDEFPRLVLAPGTAEQAFYGMNRAFEIAGRWQVPAIVLSDQFLSDSLWTVPRFDLSLTTVSEDCSDADWVSRPAGSYRRYEVTASGVSPRIRPGLPGQSNRSLGAEHTEDGWQTEDAATRVRMHAKRMRKLEGMAGEADGLETAGDDRRRCVVVCWGSTYGAVRESVGILTDRGHSIGMLHLSQLWPFPRAGVMARLASARRVICVEQNSTGQLAALMRRETRIAAQSVLKYDGRPFTGQALAAELEPICRRA